MRDGCPGVGWPGHPVSFSVLLESSFFSAGLGMSASLPYPTLEKKGHVSCDLWQKGRLACDAESMEVGWLQTEDGLFGWLPRLLVPGFWCGALAGMACSAPDQR